MDEATGRPCQYEFDVQVRLRIVYELCEYGGTGSMGVLGSGVSGRRKQNVGDVNVHSRVKSRYSAYPARQTA